MAISPEAAAAMGVPTGQAALPNPGTWGGIMGGLNQSFQDPLSMALLTGGLGLLSNQTPVQAMTGASGIYRQMMQSAADQEQQDLANQMTERQIGLQEDKFEFEKEQAEKDLAFKEKQLKAREEAAKVKAPKGVNDKLWKQSLDMAQAGAGVDEFGNPNPVDPSSVYRYYRTLDPTTTVNMPFGQKELGAILTAASASPEKADLIFAAASELYGNEPMARLRKRFDSLVADASSELPPAPAPSEETEQPTETSTPTRELTATTPAGQVTPYWGGVTQPSPVPSYGIWSQILGQ